MARCEAIKAISCCVGLEIAQCYVSGISSFTLPGLGVCNWVFIIFLRRKRPLAYLRGAGFYSFLSIGPGG